MIDRELHLGLGARLAEFEGTEQPESYGDVAAEYRALREGAGLLDRSHRAALVVRGDDRALFLQRLVSNDLDPLSEGQGTEAMLLTPKGMLIAHFVVHHRGDHYRLDLPAEAAEATFLKLTMYVLSAPVEVLDSSGEQGLLGVHGPAAPRVLGDAGLPDVPQDLLATSFGEVDGVAVSVTRVDYLGEEGYDLCCSAGEVAGIHARLRESGAVPVGFLATESRRIEAGRARFGAETIEGLLPPEVPALVERAISYEKGCYVGQETISRIKAYGRVNRELRGLVLGGVKVPEPGSCVNRSGKKVGEVTSACTAPGREGPIALAFVHRKHFDPGTQVEVDMEGGIALARVVPAGGPWE